MNPVKAFVNPTSPSYRWWVLTVTSIGALMASLTSGTLVIALPDIMRDLHTDIFSLLWIFVGYTLVATVLALSLVPFMNALHIAFMAGVVASGLGAVASLMRGEHRTPEAETVRQPLELGPAR